MSKFKRDRSQRKSYILIDKVRKLLCTQPYIQLFQWSVGLHAMQTDVYVRSPAQHIKGMEAEEDFKTLICQGYPTTNISRKTP